jgi:hypothetical protein
MQEELTYLQLPRLFMNICFVMFGLVSAFINLGTLFLLIRYRLQLYNSNLSNLLLISGSRPRRSEIILFGYNLIVHLLLLFAFTPQICLILATFTGNKHLIQLGFDLVRVLPSFRMIQFY